jgi:hypothetical protein
MGAGRMSRFAARRRCRPVAGWYLASAQIEIDDVLDRIVREHHTTPPQPGHTLGAPADLMALYHRIGSATLFDGAWRLLPIAEHGHVPRGHGNRSITTIIELADGRSIGAAIDHATQTAHWVIGRFEEVEHDGYGLLGVRRFRLLDDPADVPVYDTSLTLLLDPALDSGGDTTCLETGRLTRLDTSAS